MSVMYNCTRITDHVLLGGQELVQDLKVLKEIFHITHVVNCAVECPCSWPDDITYLHIPLEDTSEADPGEFFEQAHKFFCAYPGSLIP